MSSFVHDRIVFGRQDYAIAALSGGKLFNPLEWGFVTRPISQSFGYHCQYMVEDGRLVMDYAEVYDRSGKFPDINGVSGKLEEPHDMACYNGNFNWSVEHDYQDTRFRVYDNIGLKIQYTGKILAGWDLKMELFEDLGYQKPYAYTEVIELYFEEGKLVKAIDRSRAAESVRNMIYQGQFLEMDPEMPQDEYIRKCFSLDYKDKAAWLSEFEVYEEEILFPQKERMEEDESA